MAMRSQTRGFTLLELLVVIVIIVILVSMTFVSIYHARSRARNTQCLNNLRQLSQGIRMYADVHGGRFPEGQEASQGGQPWFVKIADMLEANRSVFRCPADPLQADMSYNWRDDAATVPEASLAGKTFHSVPNSGLVLVFDQQSGWHVPGFINTSLVDAATLSMDELDFEENLLLDVSSGNHSFLE